MVASAMRALYNICDQLLYHPEQPETSRSQVNLPSAVNLPFEEVGHSTICKIQIQNYNIL